MGMRETVIMQCDQCDREAEADSTDFKRWLYLKGELGFVTEGIITATLAEKHYCNSKCLFAAVEQLRMAQPEEEVAQA